MGGRKSKEKGSEDRRKNKEETHRGKESLPENTMFKKKKKCVSSLSNLMESQGEQVPQGAILVCVLPKQALKEQF